MAKNETQELSAAQAAAAAITQGHADLQVMVGGSAGAELPEVVFDRLSIERRVLGHITDEVDFSPLGPRNTLAALTQALMTDRHTTNPPPGQPRLDVDGLTVAEVAQAILEHLDRLVDAGLVEQLADESYVLTEDGVRELAS